MGRSAGYPDSGGSGLPRPASRAASQIASLTRVRTRKSDTTSAAVQVSGRHENFQQGICSMPAMSADVFLVAQVTSLLADLEPLQH